MLLPFGNFRCSAIQAACLCLLLSMAGCSRTKTDLQQAAQLENQEHWPEALAAYNRILPEIRPRDKTRLAEIHSHIGHCLIEFGHATEALAALEAALRLDPDNVDAHLRMAQLMALAEEPLRAQSFIDFVAARRPNDPEMLLVRAEIFKAEDHLDLSERDLLQAFRLSSNPKPAAENLAQLYLNQNHPDKARDILNTAIERTPRNSSLLLTLARLEEMQGENSEAESHYRRAIAIDNTPENNRRLAQFLARSGNIADAEETLIKLDTMSPGLGTSAADLELESGQTEKAQKIYAIAYERSMKEAGGSAKADSRTSLSKMTARLIEADLAGGDSAAVQAARQRLRENTANLDPESRNLLSAEIDLSSGNLSAAEIESKAALNGNSAAAHYLLGMVASRRGRRSDALTQWRSALNSDESYVPARLALAASAIEDHSGSMAEEYVIDVVREEPANIQALLLYARALLLQHRFVSATALCHRAISVQPENPEPSAILGEIALEQHQLALALLEFEKAMMLDPHSLTAIEGLTKVYEAGGSASMPQKLEKLALSGTPSSRLLEIAGRLYAANGHNRDAERCLRRAVEMDPQRESAKIALAALYAKKFHDSEPMLEKPEAKALDHFERSSPALIAALDAEQRNHQDEAIQNYESLVHAGDPTGIASNNLAWIYASQPQKLDRALRLAQHALDVNPQSPQVLDTVGVIQVKRRHFTEAIALLQSGARRALELNESPELQHAIQSHLAEARSLSGQPASRP